MKNTRKNKQLKRTKINKRNNKRNTKKIIVKKLIGGNIYERMPGNNGHIYETIPGNHIYETIEPKKKSFLNKVKNFFKKTKKANKPKEDPYSVSTVPMTPNPLFQISNHIQKATNSGYVDVDSGRSEKVIYEAIPALAKQAVVNKPAGPTYAIVDRNKLVYNTVGKKESPYNTVVTTEESLYNTVGVGKKKESPYNTVTIQPYQINNIIKLFEIDGRYLSLKELEFVLNGEPSNVNNIAGLNNTITNNAKNQKLYSIKTELLKKNKYTNDVKQKMIDFLVLVKNNKKIIRKTLTDENSQSSFLKLIEDYNKQTPQLENPYGELGANQSDEDEENPYGEVP